MVYSYKYLCFYFKCNRFSSSILGFDGFNCLTAFGAYILNQNEYTKKFIWNF